MIYTNSNVMVQAWSASALSALLLIGCGDECAVKKDQNTNQQSRITATLNSGETSSFEIEQGRCSMGYCSYSRKLSSEVVGGGLNGELIKLILIGGTSPSEGGAIEWNDTSHKVYVYCSMVLPSVISPSGEGWQADILDLAMGTPAVLEGAERLYISTCHKGEARYPIDGERFGYKPIPEEFWEVSLTDPNEIFAISQAAAEVER